MLDWDMIEPYEFHKLQLKMLNAQRSAKRWVLKCPWHIWNMDALMAVYPDAQIIFTHRDIAKALASHCSLSAKMASKLSVASTSTSSASSGSSTRASAWTGRWSPARTSPSPRSTTSASAT